MDNHIKKAKEYSGIKHNTAIFELIITLTFFIILYKTGVSLKAAEYIRSISSNYYLVVVIYLVLVGSALQLISYPLDFYTSYRVEHRFSLSRQTIFSWHKDYLKKLLIGGVLYLGAILILYLFLRNIRDLWWLYTALIYFFVSVILAKVFPVIIIPLFFKMKKISDDALRERLVLLGKRLGVKILDVYNIALGEKTKKANAAVCGIGSTKRILLSDTLLESYTKEEIEATLAHELSHHRHHHFWKLTISSFISTLAGFFFISLIMNRLVHGGGLASIYDISAFPIIAVLFVGYGIVTAPILNLVSRCYEREADRDAILFTKRPDALGSLLKKLSAQNLSDPEPSLLIKIFFYDHPPAGERIRAVREYL
ncbi:MAG: M48 family metalloprotease [Candidatus Omnitrophica bacterium]|nr:M48 family metalloprotease [Candidatus Omnitrophota bacterium]